MRHLHNTIDSVWQMRNKEGIDTFVFVAKMVLSFFVCLSSITAEYITEPPFFC